MFGNQQGGRKGHNTKYLGKMGLRPILCFIDETHEYPIGKLRKHQTASGQEVADFIKQINNQLAGCVSQASLRANEKFLCWPSIAASIEAGFDVIIADKG